MYYCVVQTCLSFLIGAQRIEMSTLTVRLTEREERDLQLACEQTGLADKVTFICSAHSMHGRSFLRKTARLEALSSAVG
jgi:hypothetical protein